MTFAAALKAFARYDRKSVARPWMEWIFASVMTMMGVHLLLWPHSLSLSRFSAVTLFLSLPSLTVVCLLVGMARLFALYTAGQWLPWCARVRSIGGGIAGIVWLQLAYALALNPTPSLGVYMYLGAAVAEGVTVFRARREANAGGA